MTKVQINALVHWFNKSIPSFRDKDANYVAERIANELVQINGKLGVEVSDVQENEPREIIFTSYSDPLHFDAIRTLVKCLPSIVGWKFIALKPARGFDFEISYGTASIVARQLQFAPITDIAFGIQLFAPEDFGVVIKNAADSEELGWLVIETGIGEELAAKIGHVEFGEISTTLVKHNITSLSQFVLE